MKYYILSLILLFSGCTKDNNNYEEKTTSGALVFVTDDNKVQIYYL